MYTEKKRKPLAWSCEVEAGELVIFADFSKSNIVGTKRKDKHEDETFDFRFFG